MSLCSNSRLYVASSMLNVNSIFSYETCFADTCCFSNTFFLVIKKCCLAMSPTVKQLLVKQLFIYFLLSLSRIKTFFYTEFLSSTFNRFFQDIVRQDWWQLVRGSTIRFCWTMYKISYVRSLYEIVLEMFITSFYTTRKLGRKYYEHHVNYINFQSPLESSPLNTLR